MLVFCALIGSTAALLIQQPSMQVRRGAAFSPRMMAEEVQAPVAMPEMSELELTEQAAKLDALSDKWRKRQEAQEDEASARIGWVNASEQINGRLAMFFLLVGLITEYCAPHERLEPFPRARRGAPAPDGRSTSHRYRPERATAGLHDAADPRPRRRESSLDPPLRPPARTPWTCCPACRSA